MKRTGKFVNAVDWKMLEATHALENWEPGEPDVPSLRTRGRVGDDEGPNVRALVARLADYYGIEGNKIVIFPGGEFVVEEEVKEPKKESPAEAQRQDDEAPKKKGKNKRGKK